MEIKEAQRKFKEEYIRERGYWVPFSDGLLTYSPEFLATYLRYAGVPARVGPLSPRVRELIYVAVDTSTTHMFGEGLAIHIRMALKVGWKTPSKQPGASMPRPVERRSRSWQAATRASA